MESDIRLILKHQTGTYLSWSADNQPNTPKLKQARRFYNLEEMLIFLQTSSYAPENPGEYEIVNMKVTYEEVTEDGSTGNHEAVTRAL